MHELTTAECAIAISILALLLNLISALSGRNSSRSSRNTNDPFIFCETHTWSGFEEGFSIITIRNKGGSPARDIAISLFASDEHPIPFWISETIPFLEKDGFWDILFIRQNEWAPDGYDSNRGAFFDTVIAEANYSSRHIPSLTSRYPVRHNTDPSDNMVLMLNHELKKHHSQALGGIAGDFTPWTREDVLASVRPTVAPPKSLSYLIDSDRSLLDLIAPPTKRK